MTSHTYFCLVVVLIAPFYHVSVSGLSIPKIFGNGMVLQAAPHQAQVSICPPTFCTEKARTFKYTKIYSAVSYNDLAFWYDGCW